MQAPLGPRTPYINELHAAHRATAADRLLHLDRPADRRARPGPAHPGRRPTSAARPYPGRGIAETVDDQADRRHAAALMRVNHAGEVAAQALYHGQALTARDPQVREALREARARGNRSSRLVRAARPRARQPHQPAQPAVVRGLLRDRRARGLARRPRQPRLRRRDRAPGRRASRVTSAATCRARTMRSSRDRRADERRTKRVMATARRAAGGASLPAADARALMRRHCANDDAHCVRLRSEALDRVYCLRRARHMY